MNQKSFLCRVKRHSNIKRLRKNLDGIKVASPSGTCLNVLMKRVRQEDWNIYLYLDKIISNQDKAGIHPIKNIYAKVYLTYEEMKLFLYLYENQTCHTKNNQVTKFIYFNTYETKKNNSSSLC